MKTTLLFLCTALLAGSTQAQLSAPANPQALRTAMVTMAPDSTVERTAGSLLIESADTRRMALLLGLGLGTAGVLLSSVDNTQTQRIGPFVAGLGGVFFCVFELEALGTQRRAGRIMKKKGI